MMETRHSGLSKLNFWREYHPTVYVLLFGTIFTRMASSMCIPYLIIYLVKRGGVDLATAGFIIGIASLFGTVAGYWGSGLSDYIGRKKVMVFCLFLVGISFISLFLSSSIFLLALFNTLQVICRSIFEPVSQALAADLTPDDKRAKVFSLRYAALNIGVSVGPPLGALLSVTYGSLPFLITGIIFSIYAFFLCFIIQDSHPRRLKESVKKPSVNYQILIHKDGTPLRLILMGGILGMIGYAQMNTTLASHIGSSFENGLVLFSGLLSLNAILVILFQMQVAKLFYKYSLLNCILFGNLLYVLSNLGYAYSTHWIMLGVSMILFTFGEMLTFPAGDLLIDRIAPEDKRGLYYGAKNIINLGNFLGPWIGGLLLSYSSKLLFITMAVITLVDSLFYWMGIRKGNHNGRSITSQVQEKF